MADAASLSTEEWAFWDAWMRAQRLLAGEVDRVLQRDFGISKAEFSILVTLRAVPGGRLRVTELAGSLGWEKSRVAHQLTRMERRGLLERSEAGAAGRRTGIALKPSGEEVVERAIRGHARTIRRLALDRLSAEQIAAIGAWSNDLIDHLAAASSERGAAADA
ncbi:MarR family winged helix-turn-helix transcriptional regulator [Amycolatopsis solani]|uniref:MarR family winged helix-turn-helix transcriptional regulator n=1 Tax=Amycolatopsis solani TaxID=3028615 RepID=UPI0025B16A92|nr:MarR family transcriptional regulator [Amycolatopsis sp. MEP2-6]